MSKLKIEPAQICSFGVKGGCNYKINWCTKRAHWGLLGLKRSYLESNGLTWALKGSFGHKGSKSKLLKRLIGGSQLTRLSGSQKARWGLKRSSGSPWTNWKRSLKGLKVHNREKNGLKRAHWILTIMRIHRSNKSCDDTDGFLINS